MNNGTQGVPNNVQEISQTTPEFEQLRMEEFEEVAHGTDEGDARPSDTQDTGDARDAETAHEESDALTGDIIGYDVRALYTRMMEELVACRTERTLSEVSLFLIQNVMTSWFQSVLAQGAETINIHQT